MSREEIEKIEQYFTCYSEGELHDCMWEKGLNVRRFTHKECDSFQLIVFTADNVVYQGGTEADTIGCELETFEELVIRFESFTKEKIDNIIIRNTTTKMKVLQVHKPLQDANTINPEHVQAGYIPHWCTFTERTKRKETPDEFLDRKLDYIKQMNEKKGTKIEGIYLYEITEMLQGIHGKEEKEMCYYIRYDYIKPKS